MALLDHQLISRFLPGRPFGDGRDGALSIGSNTQQSVTARSCSGTSGSTSLSLASSGFTNGDIVLIHQVRGTGAGQWEINMVSSGGGTTTLTLNKVLSYTFTDDGAENQAQVIKIPMYSSINVSSSFTWSATGWNQDTGGFLIGACNGVATFAGTAKNTGNDGTNQTTDNSSASRGTSGSNGGGFRGGQNSTDSSAAGQGEGSAGAGIETTSANGNGGGGADGSSGGLNSGAGGSNGGYGQDSSRGSKGGLAGNSELTIMTFGGGGGGGRNDVGSGAGGGGCGGGNIVLITKSLVISSTGAIQAAGSSGGNNGVSEGSGGGGAGGSILIVCQTANTGTTSGQLYALAGGGPNNAGDGGDGRIAIHYSGVVSGAAASPAATTVFDGRLIEFGGAMAFF